MEGVAQSETRGKTFWCPCKTCGRAGATSGLTFNYPLNRDAKLPDKSGNPDIIRLFQ